MATTLSPDQEALLQAHVATGDFASIEEAARQLIDDRTADLSGEDSDDMAWAEPYVVEAREAIARGDVITLQEHRARNSKRLAALRK